MSKQHSRFFLTFVGEMVQLTTDLPSRLEVTSDEGSYIEETSLTLQGFLLDEDLKYYYLGESPDHVTEVVKKVSVKRIRIVPVRTKADEMFDKMEPEGGVN
jgi:hypothetical protein